MNDLIPYCPYCNINLELNEHYDCYDDGDTTIYYAMGYCNHCKRNYNWKDIFKFDHFEDLEED